MTDRELLQMALDALNNFDKGNHGMRWQVPVIKALRARLLNEFNPDWDAMSAMVEEQQRMAKRIEELEAALAQPEQDDGHCQACEGNYCTAKDGCVARDNPPPQRDEAPAKAVEWQGLTDEEIVGIASLNQSNDFSFARAIEAKLKEKNT